LIVLISAKTYGSLLPLVGQLINPLLLGLNLQGVLRMEMMESVKQKPRGRKMKGD
jgi:hypothetical protein